MRRRTRRTRVAVAITPRAGYACTRLIPGHKYLKFGCTGCGNCCKDPLLPLTDSDIRRIVKHTGESAAVLVRWVDRNGIDMDDEPEAFVMLRQGKRVMVLKHEGGGCRYLDAEDRCGIYASRPLGCRIFPFDPTFSPQGKLRRLKLIDATDCKYELNGENDVDSLRTLHDRHEGATRAYQVKVAEWNQRQSGRQRRGKKPETAAAFLAFLGLS